MKKIFVQICILGFALLSFSCVSSKKDVSTPQSDKPTQTENEAVKEESTQNPEINKDESYSMVTSIQQLNFSGGGIKIECENMFLSDVEIVDSQDASGQKAIHLTKGSSTASVKITFPAGRYEGLVSELAPDSDHSAFYVLVGEDAYRVYPSDPPLGFWELTTRVPIYFDLDDETELLITIQTNSKGRHGSFGMKLDYIQFVKLK